jgi:hypothetical protein
MCRTRGLACRPGPEGRGNRRSTLRFRTGTPDHGSDTIHPCPEGCDDLQRVKRYDEVITTAAETKEGLFKAHCIDDKLFFEIPTHELDRDMLLLGRVDEGAGLSGGFANGRIAQEIVRWERSGKQIHLRTVSFSNVSDSTVAIGRAVRAMERGPIMVTFDIETFGADSAAVIDATKLYTGNIPEMSPLRGVQNDRSWVERFSVFPENVEVQATQTGVAPPQGAPGGSPPVTGA